MISNENNRPLNINDYVITATLKDSRLYLNAQKINKLAKRKVMVYFIMSDTTIPWQYLQIKSNRYIKR